MATATASYPGILAIKEVEYTQSLGVAADAVAIRMVPQAAAIATGGTVTIGYTGQTSITLPNCTLDSARTVLNTEGFITSVVLRDRRELWKYSAPISGRYNIIRNNSLITSTRKSLRELVKILLNAMGEVTPDVSRVTDQVYPEVNWRCEQPDVLLTEILNQWGYGLALGFGIENVVIHEIGVGTALPTDSIMMQTSGLDATLQPRYVRTCFGKSVMQARFLLEAVALDTDDVYDTLATVSYKPSGGWETADIKTMETVKQETSEAAQKLALQSVYKVYRVKQFSDGDLVVPDSDATVLNSITQCFPLENRLLETITTETGGTVRAPAKVYGVCRLPEEVTGQPASISNTSIDDELNLEFTLDGEKGLLFFPYPVYKIVSEEFKPADLYLECSFSIMDNTTNQYFSYHKDVMFDPAGYGYASVYWPVQHGQEIVAYNSGHAKNVSSNVQNKAVLDAQATVNRNSVSGRFTASAAQTIVYQYPRLSLRLDGLRKQVKHIISDGEQEPGSYTIASVGMEFDSFVKSLQERAAEVYAKTALQKSQFDAVIGGRAGEGND